MRMWNVNPRIMCRKHLLGEHVELHMFVGTLNKKKNILGYINNNLLEPLNINNRHNELVKEMERRGYKHSSKLPNIDLDYLPSNIINHKIDNRQAFQDLITRCKDCRINVDNCLDCS